MSEAAAAAIEERPVLDWDDPLTRAQLRQNRSVTWDLLAVLEAPCDFILETSCRTMLYSQEKADKDFRRQQRQRKAEERAMSDLAQRQKAVRA